MFTKCFVLIALIAACSAGPVAVQTISDVEYYIVPESLSFPQAWAYCRNAGHKFASVLSASQNVQLARTLEYNGYPSTSVWVGGISLRNNAVLNKWYWVDGLEYFNYVNWASSPASPATSTVYTDYCTVFTYSSATNKGTWISVPCTGARYFACQK